MCNPAGVRNGRPSPVGARGPGIRVAHRGHLQQAHLGRIWGSFRVCFARGRSPRRGYRSHGATTIACVSPLSFAGWMEPGSSATQGPTPGLSGSVSLPGSTHAEYAQELTAARATIDDLAFEVAWKAGRQFSLEAASRPAP
jgi:hypothetical protein